MSLRRMLKSIWTKMPKIPKGVCAGARTSGRACHRRRNKMVCLPCRQLKHTHGKPDSQSCLEFPLEKFRPKFHPSTIQMLALFHGMLLVAQINLSAFPTLLPAWHSPSVKHNQHFPPHPIPPNTSQRTAGCPLMQRGTRESQACTGLSSVLPCPSVQLNVCTGPSAFHMVPLVLILQVVSSNSSARRRVRVESLPWEQCYSSWTGL